MTVATCKILIRRYSQLYEKISELYDFLTESTSSECIVSSEHVNSAVIRLSELIGTAYEELAPYCNNDVKMKVSTKFINENLTSIFNCLTFSYIIISSVLDNNLHYLDLLKSLKELLDTMHSYINVWKLQSIFLEHANGKNKEVLLSCADNARIIARVININDIMS